MSLVFFFPFPLFLYFFPVGLSSSPTIVFCKIFNPVILTFVRFLHDLDQFAVGHDVVVLLLGVARSAVDNGHLTALPAAVTAEHREW